MILWTLTIGCFIFVSANAQLIPQCQCSAVNNCKQGYVDSLIPCADQCQQHAASMGASYQALKGCIQQYTPQIRRTFSCVEQTYANACTNGPPKMVIKRYPETLKIAALAEINSMLRQSDCNCGKKFKGIQNEAKSFLAVGKRFYQCFQACLNKKHGNCVKNLNCGLDLPPDMILVQQAKQCAISSGLNTPTVQQMCQCAASAGVRNIQNICPRIIINQFY